MSKRNFSILAITVLLSCNQSSQRESGSGSSDSETNPIDNLNIQTYSFTEVDSSGIILFPLSMGETKRNGGSLSYKDIPDYSHWNIIFFNTKTDEYHLLTDRKMLIRSYELKSNDETVYHHIFYRVTSFDNNKDKLLTTDDPEYLFISDRTGKNFRQISPEEYSLINWEFIQSSNKVLMAVKKDSDKNNKFDDADEITTFEIDVEKDSLPRQVFPGDLKDKLKTLYDRDWKRLKK